MSKVTGCILVALALVFIIYIDVVSVAPAWSIYMEMIGIVLALLAGLLYLLHYNNEKRRDDDGHFDA